MKRLVLALALMLASVQPASAQFYSVFSGQNYFYSLNWGWSNPYACESYAYRMHIAPMSMPYGGWWGNCNSCYGGCNYGVMGTVLRDYLFNDRDYADFGMPGFAFAQQRTPRTDTARITMNVPAGAEVLVQGEPTKQTGVVRTFVTPKLNGPTTYQVRVKWRGDDKNNEQLLALNVKPGDHPTVRILR